MLFTLTFWQLAIIFGTGLVLGGLLYGLVRSQFKKSEPEVDHSNAEQQLKKYRFAVHQHLTQTSDLIQHLGQDFDRLTEQFHRDIHELDSPGVHPHIMPHFKKSTHHVEPKLDTMPKTYVDPDEKHHI